MEEVSGSPAAPRAMEGADEYLYGIDLYNYAYWWECHEVLERLWHAAGRKTEQANFFRALIQLAAANLKHFLGDRHATSNLLAQVLRDWRRFLSGIWVLTSRTSSTISGSTGKGLLRSYA